MKSNDLCLLSIRELSAAFQALALSPVEVTDAYLARIEQLDSQIHSYLTVCKESARAEAKLAEREIRQAGVRSPLHGVPIALKDLFDTSGVRTTAGSPTMSERVPKTDAYVVSRLKASGAVLLGKQMMWEFALGAPRPDDFFPPARNPWDLDRLPGGSSSGSAAGLIAGLCVGSLGTDTAGSIRHPAAHCGIVGLKPTYGLVSRRGVIPLSWTLDHVGPMARTVEDVAILLAVIAQYDAADPASARVPTPDYSRSLIGSVDGLRIGIPVSFIDSIPDLDAAVRNAFNRASAVLEQLGAKLIEIEFPDVRDAEAISTAIMLSEALAYHDSTLRRGGALYGRGFRERLLPGLCYTATEYLQAQRARALMQRQFHDLTSIIDLIATPTMPRTAPTLAEDVAAGGMVRTSPFTRLFNLTGQPSISVPCGADRHGLPIGLMLSGRAFEEATVLRAADAYERHLSR